MCDKAMKSQCKVFRQSDGRQHDVLDTFDAGQYVGCRLSFAQDTRMVTFTRSQLYELLWSKPIKAIAAEYDVNPVRLAIICDEQNIARPPVGYWQKIEHGKLVEKPQLEDMPGFDGIRVPKRRCSV